MAKTLQSLLDINDIIKQRVEQRFALLSKQREKIKSEIRQIELSISEQKKRLSQIAETDAMGVAVFMNWEAAQKRRIENYRKKDEALEIEQAPIRDELASIFVREKSLKSRLLSQKKARLEALEKKESEKNQSIWLQNNF